MLGKKKKRSLGTTESHTSFESSGMEDYTSYNSSGGMTNGWGSPDGRGGFGPDAKRKPKQKKVRKKREPGEGRNQTREGGLLFKLVIALIFLVMIAVGISVLLDSGGIRLSMSSGTSGTSGSKATSGNSNQSGSSGQAGAVTEKKTYSYEGIEDEIKEAFLTENDYSRPGTKLSRINGIVVHQVEEAGATAMEIRNSFQELADSHEKKASAHFVIGCDGTIVQCLPLDEVAYCSNSRNYDTISIECCYPDDSGRFTEETTDSLIRLSKWLMKKYKLKSDEVLRHYDVTGRSCPDFYVEQPEMWTAIIENLK